MLHFLFNMSYIFLLKMVIMKFYMICFILQLYLIVVIGINKEGRIIILSCHFEHKVRC